MSANYQLLISRLDAFIRRYYVNKIIRGSLYTLGIGLGLYLLVSLLEYKFHFSTGGRKVLFFGFIAGALGSFFHFLFPALKAYLKLGKSISHDQAASIIGDHFPEVEDKLLNILHLHRQAESASNTALIHASIDQKFEGMKLIPFAKAVDFSRNKRIFRYASIPLIALLLLVIAAPNVLRDSNKRLINNNKEFLPEAPFSFIVGNESLEVLQFDDFELKLKIEGKSVPERVEVLSGGKRLQMKQLSADEFAYTFRQVQKDLDFHFEASGFASNNHQLKLIPKPLILGFSVYLDYPTYTGRKDERIENVGDLSVPAGTKAVWKFNVQNAETLGLKFGPEKTKALERVGERTFQYQKRLLSESEYFIFLENDQANFKDSINYYVAVSPDQFPEISVERHEDSLSEKLFYFLGSAKDDYGLKSIDFVYSIKDEKGAQRIDNQSITIKKPKGSNTDFYYNLDVNAMELKPGEQLSYFFQAWDNDGVRGSKSTKSALMTYRLPTEKEFEKLEKQNNEEIKKDLAKSMEDAKDLKEELRDMQDKLMEKKDLGWEDRKNIEKLLNKQRSLEEQIQKSKENFKNNLDRQKEFKEVDESILEKQKKLEELFDQMMTEEMKELFEKMEDLLEELNKRQGLEELENLEMTNEQLEQELDRMMELFKEMEFDQRMEEAISKMEELAERQEQLSQEKPKTEEDKEAAMEEQKALEEEFEDLQEKLDDLGEMSKELNKQDPNTETQEEQEAAKAEMQKSLQNMQQNQKNKAQKSQQNAAEEMKKAAQKMGEMQQGMEMQGMSQDMESLRQLLENLVKLSFDQEALMEDVANTNTKNPVYKTLVQRQHKLREDAEMVEDSLMALAKRVFQISSFITKEMKEINYNIGKGMKNLEERKKRQAGSNMQFIMTGLNNLALMLNEVQEQMQEQMAQQMEGNQNCQNCSKPGQGKPGSKSGQKPGMGDMRDMQGQLNKQIEALKKQLEKGQKPGNMSQQLAEMAQQQAAIRDALRDAAEGMDEKGSEGNEELQKELKQLQKEMERTEEQLVNKQLNHEMLLRQQEIITRLLEHEEAERKRKMSPERKSEVAENIQSNPPKAIQDYLKKRQAELDAYRTRPPELKPYYKKLVEDYFRSVNSD